MKSITRLEDAMSSAEVMIRGEELFRRRRIEVVSIDSLRGQIKRFDETARDVESQASDRRRKLVQRLGDAEIRLTQAEFAIKLYTVEAAEIFRAQMLSICIDCERRLAEARADKEMRSI